WLIENRPEHPILSTAYSGRLRLRDRDVYDRARALWQRQVAANPKDAVILGNAATFLTLGDRDEAAALLRRCREVDPANREWPRKLGHLYRLNMNRATGGARRSFAARAVAEFERALDLSRGDIMTTALLPDLAKTAFEAADHDKARAYARQLLDRVQNG